MTTPNPFTQNTTPTTNTDKKRPIGTLKYKLGDFVIGRLELWEESTSKHQALNDLNDLAIADPDKCAEVLVGLMTSGKLTVEISKQAEATDTSLKDLIAAL